MKLIPAFIDDFLLWRREKMDKALIKTLENIAENKYGDYFSDESQSKPDDFEFGKLYYLIGEYDYGILVNLITEEEKTFYVLAKLSDGSVIKKAGIDIDPADRTDTAEIMRLLRKTNPMYSIE